MILARALRGFVDGAVSVILPTYLLALGLDAFQVGAVATSTLVGSALLTLGVGLLASRFAPQRVLLLACALMAGTGLGFACLSGFAALMVVAFVGTLNPTAGDVSVFLPTEQALLAQGEDVRARIATFARYNVGGALFGALGSLAAGVPQLAVARLGVEPSAALRAVFLTYAAAAAPLVLLYRGLGPGARARWC